MDPGWITKPLGEIAAALRAGELTAAALYEEARAAHAAHGDALAAYRTWDESRARAQANAADDAFAKGRDAGVLQGIPVSVKDLYGVEYLDTFAGTPRKLPQIWSREGPVIRAVRGQGAVLTGKTHMVEFAFGGLGANAHWPTPRNPWDADSHRVSGGSSSGAGVSLMEGSALVAFGSDTAGSVRVPASMTGTAGLKVTAGRWPLEGIVPLSPTLDTPGFLARSVADAALVFAALDTEFARRPPEPAAQPADTGSLRIGLCERHFWEDCPADIADPVRAALGELEAAGAKLVPLDLPEADEAFELFRQGSVVAPELNAFLHGELPEWLDTLDPNIAFRLSGALGLDDPEVRRRRARMKEISESAARRMEGVDALVSPTVPVTAPKLEEIAEPRAYSAANGKALRNTCIANILGLCALTLPVGLDASGIPTGLQIMAAGGKDERLLSIALAVEARLGTGRERLGPPPLGT